MKRVCVNVYKSSENTDALGKRVLMCQLTRQPCIAQRFCKDTLDYIVSERADKTCRNYKDIL